MLQLAMQHPKENLRIFDLTYRLSSWVLDDSANICLWVDETSRLVGWAVMQTPFWTIDFACQPEVETALLPEMLDGADTRARATTGTEMGCPMWFIMAFADQRTRVNILEAEGFASKVDVGEDSWCKVLLNGFQQPVMEYPASKGFIVRPIAGKKESEAYIEMYREVFETKNMTVEWRLRMMRQPAYTSELDLVVEAPDGRLAAFCICWQLKDATRGHCGQVEPLGCRAEYQQLALGRVVLAEGLRWLKALGVRKVHMETDSYRNTVYRLYDSMGFRLNLDALVFRKDYPEKAA